jgi:8-oxo-dGTP diphosphatase
MVNAAIIQQTSHQKIVNVAVAVIHYQAQYLLGFREAAQHQGNRYEFVGGKIEANETAKQALIREVAEETGIDIHDNTVIKLGRLHHDYGDKQVSLQVYNIELTAEQYEQHRHLSHGLEGQALAWVNKSGLLAGKYHLPAANKTILEWLRLPAQIAISYPLAHFNDLPNPATEWLTYHKEKVGTHAWLYIRVKDSDFDNSVKQLMALRPDIQVILPFERRLHSLQADYQIVAHQISQTALMKWFDNEQDSSVGEQALPLDRPLIISCHDAASIHAANQLASVRLQQQQAPVIGVFLSPVLATQTHPDTAPLGWVAWSALAQLADMPVIGLGGLSPAMIEQAVQYGGISVAGISQFV